MWPHGHRVIEKLKMVLEGRDLTEMAMELDGYASSTDRNSSFDFPSRRRFVSPQRSPGPLYFDNPNKALLQGTNRSSI